MRDDVRRSESAWSAGLFAGRLAAAGGSLLDVSRADGARARENRRVDARAQLRAAHELFVTIGMRVFAERARGERRATG